MHIRKSNTLTEPTLLKEQDILMRKILSRIYEVSEKVAEHYVIFAGDLIHNTLDSTTQAQTILWLNDINSLCAGVYSVIGNHELTYMKKGNIFWNLAYGSNLKVPVKFEHYRDLIHVEEGFRIDDCYFKLWHYGQEWLPITDKTVKDLVVVGHNAVKFPGLKETYDNNGVNIQELYVNYCDLARCLTNPEILKWIFLGHMHSLVGRFKFDEEINGKHFNFMLENMGSMSRTDSTQFNITRQRNMPTLYIDGSIQNVESHIIELTDKSVLCEEEISKRQEIYQKGKFIKQLKQTEFNEVDVVSEIESIYAFELEKLEMFRQALHSEQDRNIANAVNYLYSVNLYE